MATKPPEVIVKTKKQHPVWMLIGRIAGRFVAGRCLDGKLRTNADFWHRGTEVWTKTGRASSWCHRPGWQRAAWRVSTLVVVLAVLVGLVFAHDATMLTLRIGLGLAVLVGLYSLIELARDYDHMKKVVRPFAKAVAPRIGRSPDDDPRTWLEVPRDYRTNPDSAAEITLNEKYNEREHSQKATAALAASKLGLEDYDHTFHMEGIPKLVIRAAPQPPKLVKYTDIQHLMEAALPDRPVFGIGCRDKPISIGLDDESPHILISMSTGGGKSTMIRVILSQVLHNGGLGVILDPKRVSQAWARGLDNIRYERDVENIHNRLLWAADECARRYDIIDEYADDDGNVDPTLLGPRIMIVCEEQNMLMQRLRAYWRAIREQGDPTESPAVEAYQSILFMGRQGLMHILSAGQSTTARAMGGTEARENYATRVIGRATAKIWGMLAPEIRPIPKKSSINGRVDVVAHGTATPCQVARISSQEAKEWATSGVVGSFGDLRRGVDSSAISTSVQNPTLRLVEEGETASSQVALLAPPSDRDSDENWPDLIDITGAIRMGMVSSSRATLTNARARDPEFPRPVEQRGQTYFYRSSDLRYYDRNRAANG